MRLQTRHSRIGTVIGERKLGSDIGTIVAVSLGSGYDWAMRIMTVGELLQLILAEPWRFQRHDLPCGLWPYLEQALADQAGEVLRRGA